MRGDFGVSSSLQQMLPYHLVPQREAAVLQQQSGAEQPFLTKPQQPNQRNSLSNGEYFANGNSKQELVAPFPLTVSGRVSYIDEESDLEGAGDDGEVEMTAISRARDTERKISTPYSTGYEDSNAGSGSYGSRNQTSTLPLNQQHT